MHFEILKQCIPEGKLALKRKAVFRLFNSIGDCKSQIVGSTLKVAQCRL